MVVGECCAQTHPFLPWAGKELGSLSLPWYWPRASKWTAGHSIHSGSPLDKVAAPKSKPREAHVAMLGLNFNFLDQFLRVW